MERIIISGGGTGGHIFPALAVAKALKARFEEIEILFVGARGRMEMEKVPKHGFEIKGLNIAGVQRKMSWSNLKVPFKVMSSLVDAAKILREFNPDVVAGFGGYASGPLVYMAQRKGIPSLIQEQNSYAGWTNKILSKKADRICVAFDGMSEYFPDEKIVMTGNPVRAVLSSTSSTKIEALRHFGFDEERDKKTLLIFGGSLGARTLNEAMEASWKTLQSHPEVRVIWQAGKLFYDSFKDCKTAKLDQVTFLPFIDRMDLAYLLSDFVVCRAGALTISELTLLGKPAVLVPSPNVSEDHQTKNAVALVKKKAAVMIKDSEAKAQLIPSALRWIHDENYCRVLKANIKLLARPDATERIVDELVKMSSKEE